MTEERQKEITSSVFENIPELLCCPKCRRDAFIEQIGNNFTKTRGFDVGCKPCRIRIKNRVQRHDLDRCKWLTIKDWNQRQDLTIPPEVIEMVDNDTVQRVFLSGDEYLTSLIRDLNSIPISCMVDGKTHWQDGGKFDDRVFEASRRYVTIAVAPYRKEKL